MPGIIRRIWRACRLRALGVMSAVATLALATAGAQAAYPERAITLIVPFAAGGPTDIVARIVSLAFQKSLGQSVVVENRGGAAGTATQVAFRAGETHGTSSSPCRSAPPSRPARSPSSPRE